MELWIRNQKKDILLKVDSLLIDDNNNDIYTQCWVGVNLETYTLGKYKTKERALQVLDEIQNFIEKKCMKHISSGGMFCEKYAVYQMPKE